MIAKQIKPEQTQPLRHLVLWSHIEKKENCTIDIDHRDDAFHLGVFLSDELVAVGSFFATPTPKLEATNQYQLRALATHPSYRGMGAGEAIIARSLEILREKNQDVLWCNARIKSVGFYEHMGFCQIDELYELPHVGYHKLMWLPMKRQI